MGCHAGNTCNNNNHSNNNNNNNNNNYNNKYLLSANLYHITELGALYKKQNKRTKKKKKKKKKASNLRIWRMNFPHRPKRCVKQNRAGPGWEVGRGGMCVCV